MAQQWWTRAAPAAFGVAAALVVWLVTRRALPDDAFITLDYARNVAEGRGWGLLPGRPSNTATSPLNVWLLAAGTWATGRPVVAVGLVLAVALGLVGWWADGLRRALRVSTALPYLVVGLLACSPLLVSTVGLETYLACAALLGVAVYAAEGRSVATGALVGAAVLVRPDLAVPAIVLAIGGAPTSARTWSRLGAAAGVAAAVVLPWHLFAWWHLGGFLPDTVFFKSGDVWTVRGRGYHFADGWLLYGQDFTKATVLTLAPAVVGLVAASAWLVVGRRLAGRRAALAFAAAGAAHWVAFAALGTAPYAWYLAPSVVCLAITAAIAASSTSTEWAPRGGSHRPQATHRALSCLRPARAAPVCLIAASVLFLASWGWSVGPINYNWGTAEQYARIGTDVAAVTRGEPIEASWEIGTTVFYCRCQALDWFGDRARTDEVIARRLAAAGPLTRAVAAVNFAHRAPTPATSTRWYLGPGQLPGAAATWQVSTPAKGTAYGSLLPR